MINRIFTTILLVICLMSLFVGPANAQTNSYTIVDLGGYGSLTNRAIAINEKGQVIINDGFFWGEDPPSGSGALLWENGMSTNLGTLGGDSIATDINNQGQVIGNSYTASGENHAFLWEKGVMLDLGTLGGNTSIAYDINDRGQIVGSSTTASGEVHPFLWQSNQMIDLGTLGGNYGSAQSINEEGQIAGDSYTSLGSVHAFLWENGVITDLGTVGSNYPNSFATKINNHRQIIGTSNNPYALANHAFLWENGDMIDLGTLGGTYTYAQDINDNGQIVGNSSITNPGVSHAFLWQNGSMIDLGTLGPASYAYDINEHGQIVGVSFTSQDTTHAFLWQNGSMIDLGTLDGWEFSNAEAINERGEIAGSSSTILGPSYSISHAVLWITPAVLSISMDIKPGSNTNPINLGTKGVIPVAVLTTAEFKASDLDPATVLFAGASPLRWSKQDVDYDGDMDLLFHFDVQKLQLTQSSVEASLTGKTYAGMSVKGTDKIKIVPKPVSYP